MSRICNILVVEDDEAVRLLLGDILDIEGYRFTLASNGTEMRAALDKDQFDVVIIDISLRGGEDGFILAEVVQVRGCGVILTTGDPLQRPRLEIAARRHLMKPFRVQQLTALVDELLQDTGALCTRHGGCDGGCDDPALDAAA